MATSVALEEPPTKKQSVDVNLCLKCQGKQWVNFKNKVRKLESLTFPKPETYQKFLDFANERSKLGNPDFIHLNQWLNGLSAEIL